MCKNIILKSRSTSNFLGNSKMVLFMMIKKTKIVVCKLFQNLSFCDLLEGSSSSTLQKENENK